MTLQTPLKFTSRLGRKCCISEHVSYSWYPQIWQTHCASLWHTLTPWAVFIVRRYDYRTFRHTFGTLFRVFVGQFSFQFEGAEHEYSAQTMFALYLLTVLILLINLLIAVLSAEHSKVYEDVDKEYNLFYSRFVMKLQRSVSSVPILSQNVSCSLPRPRQRRRYVAAH
jgi:hypothetical protein